MKARYFAIKQISRFAIEAGGMAICAIAAHLNAGGLRTWFVIAAILLLLDAIFTLWESIPSHKAERQK